MEMDLATLVTLINENAVDASSEVNSEQLTKGQWQKLGGLELYKVFQAPDKLASRAQAGPAGEPAELFEQNLIRFFGSVAVNQMRIDSFVVLASAALTALLSVVAHRWGLIPALMAGAWGIGYLVADQVLFRHWIQKVRRSGFKALPWQSRVFLIVAIALPCYLLTASFVPELPGEGLFRLVDSIVCTLYGAAAAAVWTFRLDTLRAKRAFELSVNVNPRLMDNG